MRVRRKWNRSCWETRLTVAVTLQCVTRVAFLHRRTGYEDGLTEDIVDVQRTQSRIQNQRAMKPRLVPLVKTLIVDPPTQRGYGATSG